MEQMSVLRKYSMYYICNSVLTHTNTSAAAIVAASDLWSCLFKRMTCTSFKCKRWKIKWFEDTRRKQSKKNWVHTFIICCLVSLPSLTEPFFHSPILPILSPWYAPMSQPQIAPKIVQTPLTVEVARISTTNCCELMSYLQTFIVVPNRQYVSTIECFDSMSCSRYCIPLIHG